MHDNRKVSGYGTAIEATSETYRSTKTLTRSEETDRARFLRIARGSACEVDSRVTMAARVGVVDGESGRVLCERLEKLEASLTHLDKRMSPP